MQQAPLVTATHVRGRAVAAAATKATFITLTNSGLPLTKDQYADGTIFVSDGAAEGHVYIIKSHAAAATTATVKLFLDEEDGIADEALTTASKVGLRKNKFLDIVAYDSSVTSSGIPLGVAPVEVANDRYFWCQSWGEAAILAIGVSTVAGYRVRPFASAGVDGGVRPYKTASAAATDRQLPSIGIIENLSTATGYSLIFLTISR